MVWMEERYIVLDGIMILPYLQARYGLRRCVWVSKLTRHGLVMNNLDGYLG